MAFSFVILQFYIIVFFLIFLNFFFKKRRVSQKISNNKTRGKVIKAAEETFFFLSYTQNISANIKRKNNTVFAGRPPSTSLEVEGCEKLCESSQKGSRKNHLSDGDHF